MLIRASFRVKFTLFGKPSATRISVAAACAVAVQKLSLCAREAGDEHAARASLRTTLGVACSWGWRRRR